MAEPIRGVLRRDLQNPRYFADAEGRAVYLTGSHTWNNLQDMGRGDPPPPFDFDYYLDFLEAQNHNFIRLWAWDMLTTWHADQSVRPFPWARTGPGEALDGKPKFDLERCDPEHFERLRTRLRAAQQRGVYVSVMLFEAWAVSSRTNTPRQMHLFAGPNNVNGVDILASEADEILRDWVTLDAPRVVALQEAYVRHLVDQVNGFDNLLYEICNEAGAHSHDWQEHFIRFIRDCEAGMPKQHPVGTTGGMGTLNERTYASSADWVSPETNAADGHDEGYREGAHTWGSAPFDRADKVVLLDTDHLWGIGGDVPWAWKSFCRGYNVLYMDRCDDFPAAFFEHPTWPEKFNPDLRREMGRIRAFALRMDLDRAVPHNQLSGTGYCLADPGRQYLVYQPDGGPFELQAEQGDYQRTWHDPATGESAPPEQTSLPGGRTQIEAPWAGPSVLFLRRG